MGLSKSASNFAKHGVTFEMACEVFKDAFAIENYDDRENYGEPRYTILEWLKAACCSSPSR